MSVYSNKQIRQAIANNRIICHPLDDRHINDTGLEVTLGHYYYRIEAANQRTIFNPFDRKDVERYFDGPYKAFPHADWCQQNGLKPIMGIPGAHPVIALHPGERILAHTHEYFGIVSSGICEISGLSNWGRSGVVVYSGGGHRETGSVNRAILEICNINKDETVLLPVGERIARVFFQETGKQPLEQSTSDREHERQKVIDLDTIIRTWSPSLMLPSNYLDHRELPPKIAGASYE